MEKKHFQPRGTAWALSIIWGSQVKIQGVSQRCQIARGRSPSESLGALDMNSSNESCMIKRTSSGSMATQHYRQWHLSTSWGNGHSQKIPRVNQRPARLTGLGKNKGFPANQKGSGKNKGWKYKKICTPGKSKTWKGGLGKNGYPGGLKTRKGGPGKS